MTTRLDPYCPLFFTHPLLISLEFKELAFQASNFLDSCPAGCIAGRIA